MALGKPAVAQTHVEPPIGSRLPQAASNFPTDESRFLMDTFGRCIVKANPTLAREFVLTGNDHWYDKKFRSLPTGGCFGNALFGEGYSAGTVTFRPTTLRYIAAEALVKMDLGNFDPTTISSAGPLQPVHTSHEEFLDMSKSDPHFTEARVDQEFATAQNDIALFNFGECVVRTKPTLAQRLLNTKINSRDEGQALLDLVPTFGSCLDVGHQFVTDRQILRGVVAFNYYRLAYAPRVAKGP